MKFLKVPVVLVLLGIVCNAMGEGLRRIAVKEGRFVVEQTGDEFKPYGVNYCRLDNKWHSVFTIGCYDAARFDAMLDVMTRWHKTWN